MDKISDIDEKIKNLQEMIKTESDKTKELSGHFFGDLKTKSIQSLEGFDVSDGIKKVVNKMTNIGKGLEKIFKGLFVDEVRGLGEGINKGVKNINELMFWTSEYFFTYILCGLQYIQNLHQCIFFYALDTFGKILYFPIDFVNFLAWEIAGQDLYSAQQKIWDVIYGIDAEFNNTFGFHFARYPDNTAKLCYSCRRLKVLAVKSKAAQVQYDFEKNMPQLLQAGIQEMIKGADLMGK